MAVNKLSSKLRLSVGASHNNDFRENKAHPETPAGIASGDIEWQWTSPVGTVSNVRVRVDKTPLQQMKKPCKSISPVSNDFPRKRKLIKNEEIGNKFGSSAHSELSHYVTMCEPAIKSELAVNNECAVGVQCSTEDYCTLFDDNEDAMDDCLIQCSQLVEESLSRNPKGIVPLDATTPRRSTRVHSAIQKTSANSSKAAAKHCIENNTQGTNNKPSYGKVHRPECMDTPITLDKSVHDAPGTLCEITTKYELDDSFDDILVTFCEENVELLSQPTNERHSPNQKFPLNVPNHRTSTRTDATKTPVSSPKATQPVIQQVVFESSLPLTKHEQWNRDKTDDDFLQPDLLKLLESVEANSQPRPSYSCTPAEIEQKRRQAKLKLERKKITSKCGLVRT